MAPSILVFGLPRTGTQSLCDAIEYLTGGTMYHMREVGKNSHQQAWIDLLDRKFAGTEEPEDLVEDLKKIMDDYVGEADFPASIFVPELQLAYPDAKVIVTERDEDAWVKSMESTLWYHYVNGPPQNPAMRPLAEKYHFYCWANDFPKHGRQYFREYHASVRKLVPKERMLEYDVKMGWEPLCKFLGEEVPDEEFFRSDENAKYKPKHLV